MKLRDVVITVAILAASVLALRLWPMPLPYYDTLIRLPWELHGIWSRTIPAALQAALFWAIGIAAFASVASRLEPRLHNVDRFLCGIIGLWALAYVGGNLLGPIGLFRAPVIWAVLIGCWWWGRRRARVVSADKRLSAGMWVAVLTAALTVPVLFLVQLGCPVPSYMDIFATPAAAQRIVTFGRYLPFDNDPYGYWGHALQCPGVELLYALVSLGGWIQPAVLAESASTAPLGLAFIVATYRLGRSLGGDRAGGFATMLLTATVMFHVLSYGHGRFVAFIPAAAGLGLILAPRRNAVRVAFGAVALAIAIATHAIIGSLAVLIATGMLLLQRWGIVALTGIGMLALPEVLVALNLEVRYPVIPLLQGMGLAAIAWSAPRLRDVRQEPRWLRAILCVVGAVLLVRAPDWSGFQIAYAWYPILYVGALLSLIVAPFVPRRMQATPMLIGIVTCFALDVVSRRWWRAIPNLTVGLAVEDLHHKIEYWFPYVLIFPSAVVLRWLSDVIGVRVVVYALLVLLSVPMICRTNICDPNRQGHALVQEWAHSLEFAKRGYWGVTGDPRWAQSQTEFQVIDILLGEVEAGRITMDTHIVHLEPAILMYMDTVLFSVYTGINDDTYVEDWVLDRSTAAGRFYPIEAFQDRMATSPPPYIVIHAKTLNDRGLRHVPDIPPEYEELLNRDGIRLLRRRA
ncbi:MAG: hypothetical protein E6J72_20040 [Deltaproteobacteria bacterium]|nr:MAG: hypothetical protein E6J72_20040 [Deltaproteobacteria bacterium]